MPKDAKWRRIIYKCASCGKWYESNGLGKMIDDPFPGSQRICNFALTIENKDSEVVTKESTLRGEFSCSEPATSCYQCIG